MPLAKIDEEAGMNHALILSQTKADVVQGKIRIILLQGHFSDAELARCYVDMMNSRLSTIITVRFLIVKRSTHDIRRICGSHRGWPCRNCGSSKAMPIANANSHTIVIPRVRGQTGNAIKENATLSRANSVFEMADCNNQVGITKFTIKVASSPDTTSTF